MKAPTAVAENKGLRTTYKSHKNFALRSLRAIPEHWTAKKLKYVAEIFSSTVDRHVKKDELSVAICHYPNAYHNETISFETGLSKGTCTLQELEKYGLKERLILLTKDSESPDDIGVPTYVSSTFEKGVCGYHLTMIEVTDQEVCAKYLFRYFQSISVQQYFETSAKGITRYSLGKGVIERLQVPIPSLQEQKKIVSYLDRKTALIDELIEKKKRKIELLKEKRTALINHTVTKGLDPNVKMKDSGVEWIGDIPEHWKSAKLSFYLEGLKDGTHGSYKTVDNGVPLLSAKNIQDSKLIIGKNERQISLDDKESIVKNGFPRKGDVLLVIVGATIGKCTLYEEDEIHAFQRSVGFLRPKPSLTSKYLFRMVQSDLFQEELRKGTNVAAQGGIYLGDLKEIIIPIPPKEEQISLLQFLDYELHEIEELITSEEKKITLLSEYRQSLISEMVTGKIKVTDE